MDNTEAQVDSTPETDDSIASGSSQTEEALLADILRNTEFLDNEESLPEEQVPPVDTEESDEEEPEASEEDDTEEVEEEVEDEEEEIETEDDESTQDVDIFSTDDLDLEAKVVVKIDGEDAEVSFGDLIKGYSTEQHLSKKGRELGEARKQAEEEIQSKIAEIDTITKASAAILYSEEQTFAKQYHDLEAQIEKAREEGDTYEVNELKDKREQIQKKYWNARNNREEIVKNVDAQIAQEQEKEWRAQLEHFNETIPTLIPDFNEEVAMAIREFAIEEGIQPEALDQIADPIIVKFVDDYRRLKQGVTKGQAKRKNVSVKRAPVKKSKPVSKKKVEAAEKVRQRALSEDSTSEEQMDFLRGMAARSLNL
jgi:hypothetical protein